MRMPKSLWQKSPQSENAGETACATFGLQRLAKPGGAGIQPARLLPQAAKRWIGGLPLLLAGIGTLAWSAAEAEKPFTKQEREYWAFQKVQRREPPSTKQSAWVRNPIDAFILSQLEAKGIQPGTEADKVTLIRRVTFDLTG